MLCAFPLEKRIRKGVTIWQLCKNQDRHSSLTARKLMIFLALSHLRSIIKSLRREHSRCEKFLKMKLRRSKKFAKEELFSLKRLNGKTYKYCKNFNCGNDYLNQYAIDTSTDITDAVSFMYVDNKTNKAACIYSLSCSSIIHNSGDNLSLIPAVEIKMFALDVAYQHRDYSDNPEDGTYGDVFLSFIISTIRDFSESQRGCDYVVLYSVPQAESFYKRNFFEKFARYMQPDKSIINTDCVPMFHRL